MIRLENVCKSFDGKGNAVDCMSLEAANGDLVALLGPSGCGKTTTLRLIAGLAYPDSGRIEIDGKDATNLPARERGVAMVFQHLALWPHLNVRKNLEFGPLLRARQLGVRAQLRRLTAEGRSRRAEFRTDLDSKIRSTTEMLHIGHLLDRMPDELSGGERQRVAIARALIRQPKVMLLDEPFSNLDTQLREELRNELRRIQKQLGVTTVLVTHDPADAAAIATRVVTLDSGHRQAAIR